MQVCSYRCIASHETAQFEAFSLCILQKHNCLGLNAKIPSRPSPPPLAAFRRQPLTHESAEQLFIGWLGEPPPGILSYYDNRIILYYCNIILFV